MLEALIGLGVIALLLVAGFWWTRGGRGVPGGLDDPAAESRSRIMPSGLLMGEQNEESDGPLGQPAPVEADRGDWQHERERGERDRRS
jgi:hypothetical protein